MFSQEVADAICARIAEGESLRHACAGEGMPSVPTFLRWVGETPELAEQYARARETGADLEFDGLAEIADAEPERDDKGKIDPAWVQQQKLRIDTRKWTLARKAPKKYGDRLEQHHTGTGKGGAIIVATDHDEAL